MFSADGRWSEAFCSNLKVIGYTRTFCVGDFDDLERSISRQHVNYCFFSQASDLAQIRAAITAIRGFREDELKFSPIMLMAKEVSRKNLGDYIAMGFDDIVQFPCTPEMLRTRAKRQLNHIVKYYETNDYFGPDRRNYFAAEPHNQAKRTGLMPYRRYSVRRDVIKGVEVVDVFDHKPQSFVEPALLLSNDEVS